jgi:O-antigen ligase
MACPQLRLVSWRLAALVAVSIGLLTLSPMVSAVALGACIVAALIGPGYALQALMIATLITYVNPAIIKLTPEAGVLARLVLVAATLRVLPLMRAAHLHLLWPIWLFGALSALTSCLTSPALSISIMKVITFTLAATVVVIAYGRLAAERQLGMQSWLLTIGVTVIALSGLTLLRPSVALGGDRGLQGLLGQPQALGIFIAPFAAWSIVGVLLMRRQAGRLELWVALATALLIILTRARTGAFAVAFAVGFVFVARVLSRRRAQQASLGRPLLIVSVSGAVLLVAALATGQVSRFVTDFTFKDTEKGQRNVYGAYYASRGGGVESQWRNFLVRPWTGNGFGVYPDGKFPSGVYEFAGIPISAPIEKGFLPSAILEEGGLIGAASLALLIVWLGRSAWRARDLRWRALYVACLAVNVGECVLLAPGGIGLIIWLLMGASIWAHRTEALPPTAAAVRGSRRSASARAAPGPLSLPQTAPRL